MRFFSLLIFLVNFVLMVSGCNMPSATRPVETFQVISTATDTPILLSPTTQTPVEVPATTTVATSLFTQTPFPIAAPGECTKLLAPSEGVAYPANQVVKFIWEVVPSATKYLLEITNSTGWLLSIETISTDYEISPGMFPREMQYSWIVVALNAEGTRICQTTPGSFFLTTERTYPTEKPEKDNGIEPGEEPGGDFWDDFGDWFDE